jgi:hypothetical protein
MGDDGAFERGDRAFGLESMLDLFQQDQAAVLSYL